MGEKTHHTFKDQLVKTGDDLKKLDTELKEMTEKAVKSTDMVSLCGASNASLVSW